MTPRAKASRHVPSGGKICEVPDCGRPGYAQKHCQTHYRQFLLTGTVHSIRPYRPRTPGTVKFAGLRLSPGVAAAIKRIASKKRISHGAAIAYVLERWHADRRKSKPPR